MIHSTGLLITFEYKGKTETRTIDRMHISYDDVTDFYRILGKGINYDIYKKDGVWVNKLKQGLADNILQIVGAAIDQAEINQTYAPDKKRMG